jgi:hypothetical protein
MVAAIGCPASMCAPSSSPVIARSSRIFQFAWASMTGAKLLSSVGVFLKCSGGLHGHFIEALPDGVYPPLLRRVLDRAIAAGRGQVAGLVQL